MSLTCCELCTHQSYGPEKAITNEDFPFSELSPLYIHVLMQNSNDHNGLVLNAIEDEMPADQMAEIPFSYVIAISPNADILSNQME